MAIAQTNHDPFLDRLPRELSRWQHDGLISPDQAAAIALRYGIRPDRAAARTFRLGGAALFASIAGALALGIGIIVFFAANWLALPGWSKFALVLGGVGVIDTAGFALRRRFDFPRLGTSVLVLGALLWQAGMFLVAPVFHLSTDTPALLLAGTIGILPIAYLASSRLILAAALVDGLIFLGRQLGDLYPNAPQSYGIPLAIILAGVALYALGNAHRSNGFRPVYSVIGLLAILVPSFGLSFTDSWASLHGVAGISIPVWFDGALLLGAAAAASLLLQEHDDWRPRVEAGIVGFVVASVALVAYRPEWHVYYPALFLAIFFGLAILVTLRGYLEAEPWFVNAGIALLAIGALAKYTDACWSVLPKETFFTIAGIGLLGLGAGLEWLRRRLLVGAMA